MDGPRYTWNDFQALFSVIFPLAMENNVPARLCLCTFISMGLVAVAPIQPWRPPT